MTEKINLELCTTGPFVGIIESKARELGVPLSPYRLVYQQDIKLGGEEVFPRVWEGKNHKGETVKQAFNGGWPGLHDAGKLRGGAAKYWDAFDDAIRILPDLEPENWQHWFKSGTRRQIIDGIDVIRTVVAACGAPGVAFTFYPEMCDHITETGCWDQVEWIESLTQFPDAYWYDRPGTAAPLTDGEYAAGVERWLETWCRNTPASRINVFRSVCTSGEYRPMTEHEQRFTTDRWAEERIVNHLLWVDCDTQKAALAAAAILPDQVRWMREGGA